MADTKIVAARFVPVNSFYVILEFTCLIFSVLLDLSLCYPLVNPQKGTIRINLKHTLEKYVMQLKNNERTLEKVAIDTDDREVLPLFVGL